MRHDDGITAIPLLPDIQAEIARIENDFVNPTYCKSIAKFYLLQHRIFIVQAHFCNGHTNYGHLGMFNSIKCNLKSDGEELHRECETISTAGFQVINYSMLYAQLVWKMIVG